MISLTDFDIDFKERNSYFTASLNKLFKIRLLTFIDFLTFTDYHTLGRDDLVLWDVLGTSPVLRPSLKRSLKTKDIFKVYFLIFENNKCPLGRLSGRPWDESRPSSFLK